ncbi:MAG: HAMP domain-containing sensor histidine kinase [Actinomycetota bacterium]
MKRRSLSRRLLWGNLAVAAVAAATLFATARLLGPQLFESRVEVIGGRYGWSETGNTPGGGGPGREPGSGQQAVAIEDDLNDAFGTSLTAALVAAVAAGGLAAVVGASLVSRRVLEPLDRMRTAVRHLAQGRYDERVPEPEDRELADLAGDVNALGSALRETEQRRARLVSDLAHELRTPITSLDGFVEGLEDGVFAADAETLGAMRHETRRLLRLAADLGSLSRADDQAFELHLEDADLAVVAAGAAAGLAAAFAAAEVALEVVPGPVLPVRVDADRMGQVFANVLRNALQHTPAGGAVTIRAEQRPDAVAIEVADTGEGIAPEHLGRIFERFFRVDGPAPASGGAGIGLTIARGIARAHGGDVAAASPGPGRGATFTVTVPRVV